MGLPSVTTTLALPGKVTVTGLELPASLSFEDWQRVGEQLQRAEHAVMWWLGDWWAFGEHRYGERSAQAVENGFNPNTLMNAAWVCRQIPISRRHEVLSFSHHYEVAALQPAEADALLNRAEAEGWGHKQLRSQIRQAKAGTEGGSSDHPQVPWRTIADDIREHGNMSYSEQAGKLDRDWSTVQRWIEGVSPRFEDGVVWLRLHKEVCGPDLTQLRLQLSIGST